MIIFMIILIILDQITKYLSINKDISIIQNIFSIEYVENRGAVFGIMQGSNTIMLIISFAICLIIFGMLIYKYKNKEKVEFFWYIILAGGIGNLIDRIVRGYVIDFIKIPLVANFNLADSYVVIGVFCFIFLELKQVIKENKKKEK